MVTICCVCNRTKTSDGWQDQPAPDDAQPSHGYCPRCASKVRLEIKTLQVDRSTSSISA